MSSHAWRRAYRAEFVRHARARGWTRENAAVWAGEIVAEAQLFGGPDPQQQARIDVVELERESV